MGEFMSKEWVEVVGHKPEVGSPLILSSSGENLGKIVAVDTISDYANLFNVTVDTGFSLVVVWADWTV